MYIKIRQINYHIIDLTVRSCCLLLVIYCICPWRFASHYSYLKREEMIEAFVEQITRNVSLQQLQTCDYEDIIDENIYIYKIENRKNLKHQENILAGGEFYPDECRARFSTAIIIPYRQREHQLHTFLTYMHNYLRQQRIHYRIFLIEQYDQKPFNRAKLFNIGSLIAAEYGFPCLILHDVDLLPLNLGQLYACTKQPRHLCSALDTFRYNLPYSGLFGGAIAISTKQYFHINGMSNLYEGWGGEDDDLYLRLITHNYDICRFAPAYSEYTMLQHKREKPSEERNTLLRTSKLRLRTDGLNQLEYTEKERRLHSLFTHILAMT